MDRPVAGDHAVAEHLGIAQPEIGRTMRDEPVEFHERSVIKKQIQSLAGGQLAAVVLPLDSLSPAALFRLATELFEFLELFVNGHL